MSFRPVNVPTPQAVARDNNAAAPTLAYSRHGIHSHEPLGRYHGAYPLPKQSSSTSDSQTTILSSDSTESTGVFTPINGAAANNGATSSGQGSSQESQLLQLSQLAAAREKMPDVVASRSMKRSADGTLKDSATSPDASPGRHSGHSRNVSGVSAVSTASSRVTELSSELKTRLSYAMLKVNHGWQSRTIDEVENLASRSGSPASSNSTIPGAARSSASPQIHASHRPIQLTVHSATSHSQAAPVAWKVPTTSPGLVPPASRPPSQPSLAPPVSIEPDLPEPNSRRSANPKYTPTFLSPRPPLDSPSTSGLPSVNASPENRNLRVAADPMVVSPAHDNREKDAMEALLFMRSPGNSANMKNHFPNAPIPSSSLRNGASTVPSVQRTALPTSAPKRKSLPNGRPTPSSQPLPIAHSPKKRVGFGKSASTMSEMEVDDPTSPRRPATYVRPAAALSARKSNGSAADGAPPGKHTMAPPSGRTKMHRPRPRVSAENLDEMLDRVAAEETSSSESEGEIELPGRRGGPRMRA